MKTKAEYQEYLKSDQWLALRRRVIERDGRKCTRCPSRERLQAHHLFYRDRWEDAELSDLVTLCRDCHEREHGLKPATSSPEVMPGTPRRSSPMKVLNRLRSAKAITRKEYLERRAKINAEGFMILGHVSKAHNPLLGTSLKKTSTFRLTLRA